MPTRRTLLSYLGVLALGPARADATLPTRFEPGRDAAADLQRAFDLARSQNKRVFVDVGGEWCTWCHIFDRFVASHEQVRRAMLDHYVLLKVNYSPQERNEKLLSRWPKAQGYPHFYVLDAKGTLLTSQASGELEAGRDYDEGKLLSFLRRYAAST